MGLIKTADEIRAALLQPAPQGVRKKRLKPNAVSDEILTRWECLVRQHYDDSEWSLDRYAEELGMTRSGLAVLLRRARHHGDPRAVFHCYRAERSAVEARDRCALGSSPSPAA